MSIKAMEMALEALEVRCGTNADERKPGGVIEALRTAIQHAESEPVGQVSDLFPSVRNKLHAKGFDSDAPLYTHPAPGVPDGWKLVPIEPTDEMLNAALKFESQGSGIQGGDLVDVWKAMLTALDVEG